MAVATMDDAYLEFVELLGKSYPYGEGEEDIGALPQTPKPKEIAAPSLVEFNDTKANQDGAAMLKMIDGLLEDTGSVVVWDSMSDLSDGGK